VSPNLLHGTTLNLATNVGHVSLTTLVLSTPLRTHLQRTVKTDCVIYSLVYPVTKFDRFALHVKHQIRVNRMKQIFDREGTIVAVKR
jgi:hypothetical protein